MLRQRGSGEGLPFLVKAGWPRLEAGMRVACGEAGQALEDRVWRLASSTAGLSFSLLDQGAETAAPVLDPNESERSQFQQVLLDFGPAALFPTDGAWWFAVDHQLELALFAASPDVFERLEAEGGPLCAAMGSWFPAGLLSPTGKALYAELAQRYGLVTDLDRSAAQEQRERYGDNLRRTRASLIARRVSPLAAAQLVEQTVAHLKPEDIAPPEGFELMRRLRTDGRSDELREVVTAMLDGI